MNSPPPSHTKQQPWNGFILACLFACAAGCSDGAIAPPDDEPSIVAPPGQILISDLERNLDPDVPAADVQELVAGNTVFAIDAYHQLVEPDENLFYSPLSISTAMAMMYGGARGDTEAQMATVLNYTLSQDRLHPAFNWLDLALASRGQGAEGADDKGFRLNITNATFGQIGYEFEPDYLDLLALHYGAGMSLLDFMADPEAARKAINDWVAVRTEDKITRLLADGSVSDNTRLMLVNTVYFNAAWRKPFNPDATADKVFHGLGGDITVPFMSREGFDRYGEGPGYQAVSLRYDGDELDMVVILPDEGTFADFEASLDAAALSEILGSLGPSDYTMLSMPLFELRSETPLIPMFMDMGLTSAFDASADFSGISTPSLAISAIEHQAFIKINEAGTEATAATAVGSSPPSTIPSLFTIDRPFLFLIRDLDTGAILFLGRMVDPSAL